MEGFRLAKLLHEFLTRSRPEMASAFAAIRIHIRAFLVITIPALLRRAEVRIVIELAELALAVIDRHIVVDTSASWIVHGFTAHRRTASFPCSFQRGDTRVASVVRSALFMLIASNS